MVLWQGLVLGLVLGLALGAKYLFMTKSQGSPVKAIQCDRSPAETCPNPEPNPNPDPNPNPNPNPNPDTVQVIQRDRSTAESGPTRYPHLQPYPHPPPYPDSARDHATVLAAAVRVTTRGWWCQWMRLPPTMPSQLGLSLVQGECIGGSDWE